MATECLESSNAALLRIVHFVNRRAWAQWSHLHITPTQQRILGILSRENTVLSLNELARELGVTPATASDSLSAMERKGLALRERNQLDARKISLSLTRAGVHRFQMLMSEPDPLQDALAALSDSEQTDFCKLVAKLVGCLEESFNRHISTAPPLGPHAIPPTE